MRCAFGCRERHANSHSDARSSAYYQTPQGLLKKKWHNDKRRKSDDAGNATTCTEAQRSSEDVSLPEAPADLVSTEDLVSYAEVLVRSLGLSISREEIDEILIQGAIAARDGGAGVRQQGLGICVGIGDNGSKRNKPP